MFVYLKSKLDSVGKFIDTYPTLSAFLGLLFLYLLALVVLILSTPYAKPVLYEV